MHNDRRPRSASVRVRRGERELREAREEALARGAAGRRRGAERGADLRRARCGTRGARRCEVR